MIIKKPILVKLEKVGNRTLVGPSGPVESVAYQVILNGQNSKGIAEFALPRIRQQRETYSIFVSTTKTALRSAIAIKDINVDEGTEGEELLINLSQDEITYKSNVTFDQYEHATPSLLVQVPNGTKELYVAIYRTRERRTDAVLKP